MAELCGTRGQAQVDMYPESDNSGGIVQEPQDTEDSLIFGLLAEAAEQEGPPIPACGATFPGLDCHGQGETSGGVDSRKLEDGMDEKDKLPEGAHVCWKQFKNTGCTSEGCRFVHTAVQGMGWMPSPGQLQRLKRQLRGVRRRDWDWGKIDSFEIPRGIFP